jgi:hypothetical protein
VSGSDAFVCDRFQAAFIWPRIANFLMSDPSIEEFVLSHTDSRMLEILGDLLCGKSVIVDELNVSKC